MVFADNIIIKQNSIYLGLQIYWLDMVVMEVLLYLVSMTYENI